MLIHLFTVVEQTCRKSDVNCGANLVAGEHPYLHASTLRKLNCFVHIVLQSVLDSSRADQLNALFNFAIYFCHFIFPIYCR